MNESFDRKRYRGKKRIYLSLPKTKGIYRLYLWDDKLEAYCDPSSGKKYFARRQEPNSNGEIERKAKYFHSISEAKEWQCLGVNSQTVLRRSILGNLDPTNLRKHMPAEISEDFYEKEFSGKLYTFWDLIHDFKKHKFPLLRRSTQAMYLKRFPLFEYFFRLEVESLSPKHIDGWIEHLKRDEFLDTYQDSRTSFEKEIESLKALLNWHIGRQDDTKLVLPFKSRHKEMAQLKPKPFVSKKFMTPEECDRWFRELAQVAPKYLGAAMTQVDQLLRVSEVFAMKWSNYDRAQGIYRVCEHVVWDRLKGSLPRIEGGTKNMRPGEYYDVPLRGRVIDLLEEMKPKAELDLIFHNEGQVLSYRAIQFAYNKAFKAAELPYRSTHVCRHTGATRLLDETGDRLAVQQMGNWSSRDMADHYARIMNDRARKAIEKVDEKRHLKVVI